MNLEKGRFQEIFNTYGDSAWLALSVFIREMDVCFISLIEAVKRNNISKARENLHQMIGAAGITSAIELEEELLKLQEIVKGPDFPGNSEYHLVQIQSYLNSLFEFIVNQRTNYSLHLLYHDNETLKSVKEKLPTEIQIELSSSNQNEDWKNRLIEDEFDLILLDAELGANGMEDFFNFLKEEFLTTPVLLIAQSIDVDLKELFNKHSSINGALSRSEEAIRWLESIRIVANGRDYWQINKNSTL